MSNPLYDALIGEKSDLDRPFVAVPDGESVSYADFAARAGQAAHALQQFGVRPGDRVMVQASKSLDQLALYLGALRAGAVFVPLNTAYTPAEVEYFLGDAEPAVFVCDPKSEADLAPIAAANGAKCLTLSDDGRGTWFDFCGKTCSAVFAAERTGSDLAAILYTSGTTGRSKGAMLTHDNLLSNARALQQAWHYTKEDVLLHALPTYHSHGLFVAINTTMLAGASMIFLPAFDVDKVLDNLPQASVYMAVPTHYVRLLKSERLNRQTSGHMRLFTSGSAPLLAQTHARFSERTGKAILERYGLTETSMNTSNPYEGQRRPGTVGLPLPGIAVRVVDAETGTALPCGKIGSVEVDGPNVFAGYWRQPEKTYAEFRPDGFFITGDLGFFDDDGYLHLIGRAKDLIISGGLNVYPKEVEAEIDELDGVVESAVFGVPHEDFGEGVTAAVIMDKGKKLDETGLLQALKQRLAAFKVPKRVIQLDELPRNTMGKVQKNLLRQRFDNLYQS